MKEQLFFLLMAALIIALIIALICSAVNNVSAFCARTQAARKHKKDQAAFQTAQMEAYKQKQNLAKQTISEHLYGDSYGYLFGNTMITAIHLFAEQTNQVLRPNGYPFDNAQNLKLLLSAVHPDCHFPSKGYPLFMDKCDYNAQTKQFKAWFAPSNYTVNGFVVQKVNKKTVSLLHGKFGKLCLPTPDKRKLRKGDHVKVMQSSKLTDSGYLVSYSII